MKIIRFLRIPYVLLREVLEVFSLETYFELVIMRICLVW